MFETEVKAAEVVLDIATVLQPQAVRAGERLMTGIFERSGATGAAARIFSQVAPAKAAESFLPKLVMSDAKRTLARGTDLGWEAERMNSYLPKNVSVVGKLERGKRGAWLAEAGDGSPHVVKLVSHDDVRTQINLSSEASRAVNSSLTPTPKYEAIGYQEFFGSWYMQEFIPGTPAAGPSSKLIGELSALNERQTGKAIEGATDWSGKVMDSLYHDSENWYDRLASSGQNGWELAAKVKDLTAPNRSLALRSSDIVHGDFQHYNALVNKSGNLAAYVDWDGAGRGDRGFDLARLYTDACVSESEIGYSADHRLLHELNNHIAEISGPAARDNFMGYWALQIGNFGLWHGEEDARMFINVGHSILDVLK
jgi:hypothetical protein